MCCYACLLCDRIIATTRLARYPGPSRLVRKGVISLAPRHFEASRKVKKKPVWFVYLVHRIYRASQRGEREQIQDQLGHRGWWFALYNGISYANCITRGWKEEIPVTPALNKNRFLMQTPS